MWLCRSLSEAEGRVQSFSASSGRRAFVGPSSPGPSEVRCDVDAQELDVVHPLHLRPMNVERGVFCLPGSLEVHNDLLGLAGVQDKVVV